MGKNLSKSQRFDMVMGVLMLVDSFLPWLNCGKYRCSVWRYLFECFKLGSYVEAYKKIILAGIENILPRIETAALWFFRSVCVHYGDTYIRNNLYISGYEGKRLYKDSYDGGGNSAGIHYVCVYPGLWR